MICNSVMKNVIFCAMIILSFGLGKCSYVSLSSLADRSDSTRIDVKQQAPFDDLSQHSSPIVHTGGVVPLSCGCPDGETAKPFYSVEYWSDFYRNETEPWDWYSTEDWLPEVISSLLPWPPSPQHATADGYAVLDIGCGISSLLLDLARAGPPRKWRRLVGVDFCPSAVALLRARAAELPPDCAHPEFLVADVAGPAGLPAGAFDAVVDKGCLDCHVASPPGRSRIPALLRAVRRSLAPGGALLLVAVADADLPHLLATGRVRPHPVPRPAGPVARDPAGSQEDAADMAAARDGDEGTAGGDDGGAVPGDGPEEPGGDWRGAGREPLLHVHEAVAWQHKHLLVARAAPPPSPPRLRCGECGRRGPYPPPPPEQCGCGAGLGRFALS
jgi:SAM-dependent methyltransferase